VPVLIPALAFAQVGIFVNPTNIDRQTKLDTGINHDYAIFQSDLKNYADTSSATGKYVDLTTDQTGILGNKTFNSNLMANNLTTYRLTVSSSGPPVHLSYFTEEGFTNYSLLPPSQGGYSASFHLTNTGDLDFQDYFIFSVSGVIKVIIGGYGAGNGIPLVTYGESANVSSSNQNNGIFTYIDHIERRTGFSNLGGGGQISNAVFTDAYGNLVWTNMIITVDGKHIQKSPGGNWFYTYPSDSGTYVAAPVTVTIDNYGNATISY